MSDTASHTGRRSLFNGRDLTGWRQVGPGRFSVDDGLLVSHGGMGLLWYAEEQLGDCRLRVVYRTGRYEDNSGVFVRIDGPPPDPWHAVHHGYEVQIYAPGDAWHRTGVIYSMSSTELHADAPPGEWNVMEIELDGATVRVHLNDALITEFDPEGPVPERAKEHEPERGPRPTHGYIGLQNHDEPSRVAFREISVAPL